MKRYKEEKWGVIEDPDGDWVPADVAQGLYDALKFVRAQIEEIECEVWWIDCPDKGGVDTDMIDMALKAAGGGES